MIRRPLLWYAGAYVLGEVLGRAGIGAAAAAAVLGAAAGWHGSRKTGQSRLLWLALPFFILAGGLLYQRECRERKLCPLEWDGKRAQVSGRILRLELREDGVRLWLEDCEVELAGGRGGAFPGLLLFLEQLPSGACEGRRICMEAVLGVFEEAGNPGGFDSRSYYRALGVSAMAYGEGEAALEGRADLLRSSLRRARTWMGQGLSRAAASFPGGKEAAGLLRAMVLGEKWEAPEEVKELYEDSGAGHLLAISGLHISMAGMGVFRLLRRRLRRSYFFSALSCALAAFLCYVLTGEGTSAGRAFLMLAVYGGSQAAGRGYDPPSAAALAALLTLMGNPLLLFQCGFLLSYGSVLALGLLQPLMKKCVDGGGREDGGAEVSLPVRAWRRLARSLLPGTAILAATLPVQACFFYKIPVYGVFLNLPLVPLFLPLALLGILCGILGNLARPLAAVCFFPVRGLLGLYELLCRGSLILPGAVWRVGRPENWQLGIYGVLLILFGRQLSLRAARSGEASTGKAAGENIEKPRRNGTEKQRFRRLRSILRPAAVPGIGLAMALCLMPVPRGRRLEMTFLDVGQGDCCFIRTPGGTSFLVDGGSSDENSPGKWIIGPFLDSRGVGQVDHVLVSHGDGDHVSGIREMMEEGRVGSLLLPGGGEGLEDLEEQAERLGIPVRFLERGQRLEAGEVSLSCLWPAEGFSGDGNEASMVLWCSYGEFDALFTGDLEGQGEAEMLEGNIPGETLELLKVPHHGSGGACSEEFLERLSPGYGIISCGRNNRYGHPAEETLERLRDAGCRVYRTDVSGAVTVETDGKTMGIMPFRVQSHSPNRRT